MSGDYVYNPGVAEGPSVEINSAVYDMVHDLDFNSAAYANFLLAQGVRRQAIANTLISVSPWSPRLVLDIEKGRPPERATEGSYRKLGNEVSHIELFMGDIILSYLGCLAQKTDSPDATLLTLKAAANTTLAHETGHLIDTKKRRIDAIYRRGLKAYMAVGKSLISYSIGSLPERSQSGNMKKAQRIALGACVLGTNIVVQACSLDDRRYQNSQSEEFANVMEYVATDALFPEWEIWNLFTSHEGLSSQRRDSIAGVQSVKTAVNHPDEIGSLFDPSIVYAKGGRLLNMLMNYVGTDDFRKGLKAYFEKHAYGNTTGDDLWEALSSASGKDIANFMNPWLTRSGFPIVTVDQQKSSITLAQEHFLVDPAQADKDRVWPVPLLATSDEVPALLETRQTSAKAKNDDYIRINQGAVGHYIVHYVQPEHADWLAEQAANKELLPAERMMLLNDSSMIAKAGMASFLETLRLLEHYSSEDSETVWDILSVIIADTRRFIDLDPELEPKLKAFIRTFIQQQYDRLGWDESDSEPGSDKKLRATIIGLGVYAEHEEIRAKALAAYESYKAGHAVSSELRSIVLGAAVRNNVAGAFDYLLHEEETTSNPDLKQELLGALTSTKSTEEIARLLDRIKDGTKVRQHDVDTWLVYLLRNRYGRQQAWDWMRNNWDWIEKTFDGDKGYDSFPRYAANVFNTRTLFEEYKTFFEPKAADIALQRNIKLGVEELAARVAWLERDLADVQSFFNK